VVGDKGFDGDAGVLIVEGLDGFVDAGGGEVQRGDADGVGDDEGHGAVDAAIHVKIAGEGRDIGHLGIIDADAQFIFLAKVEVRGEFKTEGGEGPAMAAEDHAIEVYGGDDGGGLEADEDAFARPGGGHIEGAGVPAGAAQVAALGPGMARVRGQGVDGVPGVGDGDAGPGAGGGGGSDVLKDELPVGGKIGRKPFGPGGEDEGEQE